jgi:Zn-dependent peptidase ImmA (M78 family)
MKRRATTRHHTSGAIIYYSSCYEEKEKRILIAHELGHIVNKELHKNTGDSEQMANLFSYIAIEDKDKFYSEECKNFVTARSDLQRLNDIVNICRPLTTV